MLIGRPKTVTWFALRKLRPTTMNMPACAGSGGFGASVKPAIAGTGGSPSYHT